MHAASGNLGRVLYSSAYSTLEYIPCMSFAGHGVRTPRIQSAYVAVRLCTITYGIRSHGILLLRETGLASLARMHVRVE